MWIPPEDVDPIVLHAPTRKGVSIFGAVQLTTGRLVTLITPTFDAITFLGFLNHLVSIKSTDLPLYVILDNSRYHHARILSPWLNEHCQELILNFLPPYSPHLNPIERVWKLLRRLCTHNRYFPALEILTQTLTRQFKLWEKPNDILRRLCIII